ncbi:MAG: chemotaxis protein CheA [Rhodobacteraceae bacterium]|nr:chemotaxis protein CheA [Paracoccaceae bacterium]
MVQNNKVLTVSYGTFSCTLEGFEDSFDTMKAIAEYFRDLASDDRYFGAEPPQPDAEMLTRIAQRDIARQVEARTSDGAVHLRATGPLPGPTPDAAVIPAPVAPPATVVETTEQPIVEPPVVEPISEVAKSEVVDVAPQTQIETAPVTATAATAAVIEAPVDLAAIAAAVAAPETAELPPVEDLVATEVDAPRAEIGDDTIPAADSIAAKLQRIRAVVAQAPREEEFSEDEHAENFITESAVDIAAAMRADDEAQLAEDEDNQEQVEIAEALARIDQRLTAAVADQPEAEAESEAAAELEAEPETEIEAEAETLAEPEVTEEIEIEVEAEDEAAVEAEAEVEVEVEAISEPVEPGADDSSLFDGLEDPSGTGEADSLDEEANILAQVAKQAEISTSEPEVAAPKPARRARIVRVKRADLERAVASGVLEEVAEDEPQAGLDSSLSDADEADLLRELAAVEAELLATDKTEEPQAAEAAEAEIEPETETEPEAEAEAAAATVTRTAAETPDSDVSRLMAAADEKLEDPAAASSRETYGHLRAAMAAAQAERTAGGTVGSELRDDEYREDLASVVRPRRPSAAKTVSRRPETVQRPAPLKLVAEQRIDEAPKQKRGPVRPRRIASSQADEAEFAAKGRDGGFAEYAVESGAVELNELLEAAASYMSFIEGRDHFSRPQLMNKVKLLDSAEFNREDGLRSFGLLLREGKIEKTHNGQFTASGQIGFRPGQRAAS